MRISASKVCLYKYGKCIKYCSPCCSFGTVSRSVILLIFQRKCWSKCVYFNCIMKDVTSCILVLTMIIFHFASFFDHAIIVISKICSSMVSVFNISHNVRVRSVCSSKKIHSKYLIINFVRYCFLILHLI